MKRTLALIMVLVLALAMSPTALAAVEQSGGKEEGTVDVIIEGTSDIATKYHVTIVWGSLDFTYIFDSSSEWDSEAHDYSETQNANSGWKDNKTSDTITVTNHSNVDVSVTATLDNTTKNGVTASLVNDSFSLATGVGRSFGEADSEVITVNITDNAPNSEEGFTVGKVTVTIT